MKRLLKAHDVDVASGAQAALDQLRRYHYDIVFCDLMMPEMSGMDLHEAICREDAAAAERIVFMTGGVSTTEARDFVQRIGRDLVLDRPIRSARVRELVVQALVPIQETA